MHKNCATKPFKGFMKTSVLCIQLDKVENMEDLKNYLATKLARKQKQRR